MLIVANWRWIALVFPGWMLLLSSRMLLTELNEEKDPQKSGEDPVTDPV
jgi:hypothetical protein